MTARRITRGLAVAIAVPTALVLSTSQALATSSAISADPVTVTNTETVQARLDPSGKVQGARIYEQLAFTGKGKVKLSNPVSTDGLRNLDGFGDPSVKDGKMDVDLTVDGEQRMRTVSDFDKKKLPIKVAVTYTLNGKQLKKPGDVVGKSGRLEAHYVVENMTAQSRPVTIIDGAGKQVEEQSDVVIPMVGQLTTILPSEFGDVSSNEANKAGDGKGGTKLSFTVTLFPPVGAATAEFGWSAEVKDAIVPEAELTALPVSPLDSPTFKTAVSGYQSGAEKGADLVEGGTTLDTNLIKLRDGAQKLLGGLLQLNAGAKTLNEGLASKAAPGANKLAEGMERLNGGLGELNDGADLLRTKTGEAAEGAGKLNEGAGKLDAGAGKVNKGAGDLKKGAGELNKGAGELDKGAGDLNKGAKDLTAGAGQLKAGTGKLANGLGEATGKAPALIEGLNKVSGGLKGVEDGLVQMYGGIGQLPTKAKALHAGVQQLREGIGSVGTEGTLLGGLESLKKQLAASGPGIDKMRGGVHCAADALNAVSNGKPVGTYSEACYGPAAAVLNGPAGAGNVGPELNPIKKMILDSVITQMGTMGDEIPDLDKPLPDSAKLQVALGYLKGRLTERAVPGIARLECGLDNRVAGCPDSKPGLAQGLEAVDGGISQLVSGVVTSVQGGIGTEKDTPANKTLRGGVNGLQTGVEQIQTGGMTLLAGLNQLSDGADQLDTGAGALAAGSGKLAAGTGKLAAGTGKLAAGTGKLTTGAGSLANGTGQLEDGIGVLLQGTGRLDKGLGLLSGGTGKLATGVGDAKTGSDQLAQGSKDLATGIDSAADGSGKLSEGLDTATKGAPALPEGAGRLSKEGAQELTKKGNATALDFGRRYALLSASAARAKSEAMPFGAPEGATGSPAYSLKLAGDTGEGDRSWVRLLAGLALFGLAVGVTGLLRRRAMH